jgi:hypothetical protein
VKVNPKKLKLCAYHNARTSSWDDPGGRAKEIVASADCGHCKQNRILVPRLLRKSEKT